MKWRGERSVTGRSRLWRGPAKTASATSISTSTGNGTHTTFFTPQLTWLPASQTVTVRKLRKSLTAEPKWTGYAHRVERQHTDE